MTLKWIQSTDGRLVNVDNIISIQQNDDVVSASTSRDVSYRLFFGSQKEVKQFMRDIAKALNAKDVEDLIESVQN